MTKLESRITKLETTASMRADASLLTWREVLRQNASAWREVLRQRAPRSSDANFNNRPDGHDTER